MSGLSDIENKYFWKKKSILSYFLSILVFWIHISSLSNYNIEGIREIECFERFFRELITPVAVPLFFILSGVTFFRNYSRENFRIKIKKRVKTLVIPYLLWNIIWMFFCIITSYSFISNYFIGRKKFIVSLKNIILAIFHHECNPTFWYIFCLIVFICLSPIIDFLMKSEKRGLYVIIILIILRAIGIEIPKKLFFSSSSIIYYLIGCYIGKFKYIRFSEKFNKQQMIFGFVGIVFSWIGLQLFDCFGVEINNYMYTVVEILILVIYCFSLWSAVDIIIPKLKEYNFYKNSFFVYAMHINVGAVVVKILYFILPQNYLWAIPNFIISTFITLIIIEVFCIILKKYLKPIYLLLGASR